jgi:5-oxoprolinase (ATP-hydrolysing)
MRQLRMHHCSLASCAPLIASSASLRLASPPQFLRPLTVGILSERRALPPFGLAGGGDAARGVNLWLQAAHEGVFDDAPPRVVSLGSKATVTMRAGDRLRLLTPGGGGYGAAEEGDVAAAAAVGAAAAQQQQGAPAARQGGGSLAAYAEAQETV